MSFLKDYFDISDATETEVAVCCPFPHYTSTGIEYYEQHPSAHVNTYDDVFHCKVCNQGHNEITFIQTILGCDSLTARKLARIFSNFEYIDSWKECNTNLNKDLLYKYSITDEVIDELNIRTTAQGSILFPVTVYNHIIDERKYNPGQTPKLSARTGSCAGMILPFDLWRKTPKNKITIICAGEKDMAVARSHGFNAITFTGGEQALPKILNEFKDRYVVICYDNDKAGLTGARKVAIALLSYAKEVKICTNFHEICKEKGEDITDFFNKYSKTREDLINYIEQTPVFELTKEEKEALNEEYPIVDLLTASKAKYVNKLVRTNIQVVATADAHFVTPSSCYAKKVQLSSQNDTMNVNEDRSWELTKNNAQDILHLIDNNFKENTIKQNLRNLLKIPLKEKYIKISTLSKCTVSKATVTDLFEATTEDLIPMEYTAYAIGIKLESGKKYLVTHKLVPHPYKGQQLTMIIVDAVEASDSVSEFTINEKTKKDLKIFQDISGNVADKVNYCVQSVKGLLGYNGNDILITALDLSYHTVLQFNFGTFKNERGYLDTFVVGESRVGKSSTSKILQETYQLGTFTSLAGNAATIPGLVGGSNKVNGSYQTRAGLIPQNHRGLIIFEEFGKSNTNIISELTDIRSSNQVRITRVSGTITMPAVVRMITLTNVKATNGQIKPIASYPNGIAILIELIGTAEDIARYDILLVLSDKGNAQIDPFWTPQKPLPLEAYRTRIRWVWSRTAEQVIISKEVGLYILEKANELNKKYDCHIKIFGTEAWKKISRLAIAVAGYVVSTDETYENIIVTKECVDYAVNFFERIYNNETFKLKEYVENEKRYTVVDEDSIAKLQDMYIKAPNLLLQLEQCTTISKNMLSAATGMNNDELNKALKHLTKHLFIRFTNYDIVPTERFRGSMAKINRNNRVREVGEVNA
jgi:DNA primase